MKAVKPAQVKTRVQSHLSQDNAGKWLLIFDNADDTDMWLKGSDASPALKDFLPHSKQDCVLFTTRTRQLAVKLALLSKSKKWTKGQQLLFSDNYYLLRETCSTTLRLQLPFFNSLSWWRFIFFYQLSKFKLILLYSNLIKIYL